jgi:16S rRNA (guanine1207-N2)-methyltransferase
MQSQPTSPWYKEQFRYSVLGRTVLTHVPHDVFSTQRIDEGTLLLLNHLPESPPDGIQSVLDIGCGYGALSLPLALREPQARFDLVDRDLLAVEWANQNARLNGLQNVQAIGSLGYQGLPSNGLRYDLILCNVPARIGSPFIQDLMERGQQYLSAQGKILLVVIRDLCPVVHEIADRRQLKMNCLVEGPRHSVFAFPFQQLKFNILDEVSLYDRDQVQFQDMTFDRPFDFGGDDVKRLKFGLPVLLDALPRQADFSGSVFCFRSGYGIVPILIQKKWPNAKITTSDRDLMARRYILKNAEQNLKFNHHIDCREEFHFIEQNLPEIQYDWIMGELSSSAGSAVCLQELAWMEAHLKPGGQACVYMLEKIESDWIQGKYTKILSRDGYTVIRISKPTATTGARL